MLVLSRKPGESVHIGDGIVLTVLEVRRGRAVLGVKAPHDVTIHREEVFQSVQEFQAPSEDELASASHF